MMYNQMSRQQLSDEIAYEHWMLEFLHDTFRPDRPDPEAGPSSEPDIEVRPDGTHHRRIHATARLGQGSVNELVESFQPLVFIAAYKHIDMQIEWILGEHEKAGILSETPETYSDKIDEINRLLRSPDLILPSPVDSIQGVFPRMIAFYTDLSDHRHAVVHRNDFDVVSGGFEVTDRSRNHYEFTTEQLFYLSDISITVAEAVQRDSLSSEKERALKTYLDELEFVHSQGKYGVTSPWNSRIQVPTTRAQDDPPKWTADVDKARDATNSRSNADGFYLYLSASVDNEPVAVWDIPEDALEGVGGIEVSLGSDKWEEYRYSPPEGD